MDLPFIGILALHNLITLSETEKPATDYLKVPPPSLYQSSPFVLKESYQSSKSKY